MHKLVETPSLNEIQPRVAVIIPCYKVKNFVINVIERIPDCVSRIYCVDDYCPEQSGEFVINNNYDKRIVVIKREENGGVGAAMCTGYAAAIGDGYDILVKVDGDGQMAPELIPLLIAPIRDQSADYVKGNRFFNADDIVGMPRMRLFGNAALSFIAKVSTGYWEIFDPTNGFTAIHVRILERVPFHKLAKRYFFETDMLFRLGCLRARVIDMPMTAHYANEVSNLRISRAFGTFAWGNLHNAWKRTIYMYFVRDFSLGSLFLVAAVFLAIIGTILGLTFWIEGLFHHRAATAGQVMMSALPLIFALQFMLSFAGFDIARTPRHALHPLLRSLNR